MGGLNTKSRGLDHREIAITESRQLNSPIQITQGSMAFTMFLNYCYVLKINCHFHRLDSKVASTYEKMTLGKYVRVVGVFTSFL